MKKHGEVRIIGCGQVMLCLTLGDFNGEGAKEISREMLALANSFQGKPWALLASTRAGSLATPEAEAIFAKLVKDFAYAQCRHAALVNTSIVQDQQFGSLYVKAGISLQNYRDLTQAINWLKICDYQFDQGKARQFLLDEN